MTKEFEAFYKWAADYLGLNLMAYKQTQLQRRIQTVMGKAGAVTLAEYSDLIERDPLIRQHFLDYITINVTDFFRNPDLFEEFEKILRTELAPKFGRLNIWSAACSIGSEPYSLAMIAQKNHIAIKNKILATDIDEQVLNRACVGSYKPYELKNIPPAMLEEYFKEDDKDYVLASSIRQMVDFKKHDLLQDNFEKNLHAIVCRNVIIYFKKEAKEEVYCKFSESLVKGGILFTGATETVYKPEQYGFFKIGKFIYQKK